MHLHSDTRHPTPASSFGGNGGDDLVASASVSLPSRSAAHALQDGAGVGGHRVTPTEGFVSSLSPVQLADTFVFDHQPQQRRRRQWTPRRTSLHSSSCARGGGGAVAGSVSTLRDWVRSAGCSPSKEPRSASTSRRDSLASSFASALVPRDGQWELSHPWSGDADGDISQARERRFELRSGTVPTGSSSSSVVNSGRRWASDVSLSLSEAPAQQAGVTFASTSPRQAPSWRNLRSHPTTSTITVSDASMHSSHGSSDGAAVLHCSGARPLVKDWGSWDYVGPSSLVAGGHGGDSTIGRADATLRGPWDVNTRGADDDADSYRNYLSLSGVSSPSFLTPLASPRSTAPNAPAASGNTLVFSSSPALDAREMAQLQEWHSVAHVQQRENAPATALKSAPAVPRRSASEWCTGGLRTWRSGSLSRESISASLSDGQCGDIGQTTLLRGYCGTSGETSSTYGCICPSLVGSSTGELDGAVDGAPLGLHRVGQFSQASSTLPAPLIEANNVGFVRHEGPRFSPLTSPRTSSPSFARLVHRIDQDSGAEDEDSTMEDIEVRGVKRKCVESPHVSPLSSSLRATPRGAALALSLSDALAAEPTSVAVYSEAHLRQQQQRRKRTVSPSVARPDDDSFLFSDAGSCASPPHRARSTFSPISPIRTVAPSMVPMHSPPRPPLLLDTPHSSPFLPTNERVHPRHAGGGSIPGSTAHTSAPDVANSKIVSGYVVEVDGRIAASLSRCYSNGSDDEPEVDTYSLERAQAAMDDADTDIAGALCARQRQLYLLSTSQFARDVERHGGHVDPVQLELEGDDEAVEGGRGGWERKSIGGGLAASIGAPVTSCSSSLGQCGEGAARLQWEKVDRTPLLDEIGTTKGEAAVSSSSTSVSVPQYHRWSDPTFSAVPGAITTAPALAPLVLGRLSGEEGLATPCRTAARTSGKTTQLRWCEQEESEGGGYSPMSVATTTEPQSRRDVSPPIRERSMAPAELRKEREELQQIK